MRRLPLYTKPGLPIEEIAPSAIDHDCTDCSLHRGNIANVCMNPEGRPGGLLVVGDYPSVDDDSAGRPFTTLAGRYLRQEILKHWSGPIAFDNVLKCSPTRSTPYNMKKDTQLVECSSYLSGTIATVQPKRIIACGAVAIHGLLGHKLQLATNRRAYGVMADGTPVYAFLHPGAAMRNRFQRVWFEEDLEWALTSDIPTHAYDTDLRLIETEEDALAAEAEIMAAGDMVYDVETIGPQHDPVWFKVIALAAVTLDSDSPWVWPTESFDNPKLVAPLQRLLASKRVVKHGSNIKYDMLSCRVDSRINTVIQNVGVDTRVLRKMLFTDADGKLDTMANLVGMGGHKAEAKHHMSEARKSIARHVKKHKGSAVLPGMLEPALEAYLRLGGDMRAFLYGMLPKPVLYRYNARDTLSTAKLVKHFLPQLRDTPHVERVWVQIANPAIAALEQIEAWGMPVSADKINTLDAFVKAKITPVIARMTAHGLTEPSSGPAVSRFLYGSKKSGGLGIKCPKFTDPSEKFPNGQPAVDVATLDLIKGKHPVVSDLQEWRKLEKLRGTYVVGMRSHISADDRIHPTLNLDGARTGRLSCLAGHTLVDTQRGPVPIKDVIVGDMVWTHKYRWRRVVRSWLVGVRPVFDVTLSTGHTVTCTGSHRLLFPSGWRTIQDVYNERKQVVGWQVGESYCRSETVSRYGEASNSGAGGCRVEHNVAQCVRGDTPRNTRSRTGSTCNGTQIFVKDWHKESNVRQDRRRAPQLEGFVRGRIRVLNVHPQWEQGVCASCSDGRGAWDLIASGNTPRASHRRGTDKQQYRQLGAGDFKGSSGNSLLTGERLGVVSIDSITPHDDSSGTGVEVYDLTVADDESYSSVGVFSHNCTNPNLQNIPRAKGTLEAKMAKDVFCTREGYYLLQADYSQLELRIAALLSGDKRMLEIFQSGEDYHLRCAKIISKTAWGVDPSEVIAGGEYRSKAKNFVFGLMYGMTDGGLAKRMGCTKQEAARVRQAVLGSFPELAAWIKDCLDVARRTGWTYTWWAGQRARQRTLYTIAGSDEGMRITMENSSYNTPCQGTASDFMLKSVVDIVDWIKDEDVPAKLVITVHDSAILEVREDALEEVAYGVNRIMTSHDSGGVPLTVDQECGRSWGSLVDYRYHAVQATGLINEKLNEERAIEDGITAVYAQADKSSNKWLHRFDFDPVVVTEVEAKAWLSANGHNPNVTQPWAA